MSNDIIKREVGERVRLNLAVDSGATKDLGDGVLEAIITTSTVDRHNENIVTTGIDTKNYMEKNPVVLYGHDYFGLPIGKAIKLTETKNRIKAQFKLAIEQYDFAGIVYEMIKEGYLNAVSIGGIVRKWSEDYRTIEEMEMIEFSIVSIPANSDAMITSRSFLEKTGKSLETVEKSYEEFAKKTMLDKFKGMDNDEVKDAVTVLKTLTARLEESALESDPLKDAKHVKRFVLREAQAVAEQSQKVIRIIKLS